jgi:hypothetical protein
MDAKLDAERLEELAEWALNEQREQQFDGSFRRDQNFSDLARCAKAWAKVERERGNGALYINHKTVTWFFGDNDYTNGDTAIAAVEDAPEVKS